MSRLPAAVDAVADVPRRFACRLRLAVPSSSARRRAPLSRPDFPRNLPEFMAWFPDEDACFRCVVDSRWPDGFRCPRCDGAKAWRRTDRRLIECSGCCYQASATAGTVMHRSKMPLLKWLLAAYFVTTDKRGMSALQLAKQIGTTYETAWGMLHKLRAGMVAPDRTQIGRADPVEIDEAELGSPPRGRKESPEKIIVVGAVERRLNAKTGKHYAGRARFRLLPSGRKDDDVLLFVVDSVAPQSWVVTDAAKVYVKNLKKLGFQHSVESQAHGAQPDVVLPVFHTVVSNLKAWLAGTHHGAVSKKHLQAYLNEYIFRFNRRMNEQAAFQAILGVASRVRGPELDQLYVDPGRPGG